MGTGRTIEGKEKEQWNIIMAQYTQETGSKENSKAGEGLFFRTMIGMKGNGSLEKCMVEEFMVSKMAQENRVFGNMENWLRNFTDKFDRQ